VFGGDDVKAIYVRGGLVSFRSMLDSQFCYFPHDAVVSGVLSAYPSRSLGSYDLDALAAANEKRGVRMEALVDGLNRRVSQETLTNTYRKAAVRDQASSAAEVAAWLSRQVKK
jgi:hypothetical protein